MKRALASRSRWCLSTLALAAAIGASPVGASPALAFYGFAPDQDAGQYPATSNGRLTPLPSVRAARVLDEPVQVDGRLDDPAWARGEAAAGFQMHEPVRGGPPTEETVFKIVYDDDAVYFGVACYEKDPSKTQSNLARRDRIEDSDIVSVYIDPYLDKTTGYNFRVNPHGVVADHYIFNDGDRDVDWDAVWTAETYRDEHGWYVEMRIPFSSIRYRESDSMTWGLQVYRWMHGRGEDTGWVTWERELRGFVSRFGTVTGIEGIAPPRQLEFLPYFVQRTTDPAVAPPDVDELENFENIGADIKYGVTADLSMNATIQPDFGQVEADPAVLNLSPFETFFEEKRPFFIEGARFFEHPDFTLFYSRRIGTEAGDASRIRFADKLTGKLPGNVSVAALYALTDVTQQGQAHNPFKRGEQQSHYFVGRFGKEFKDGNHRVNVMQTGVLRPGGNRDDEREAYTTGLDFDLNFDDRNYNVEGSFIGSVLDPSDAAKFYGTGGALDLRRVGGNFRAAVGGRWEGDRLRLNDLGFLSAPDEIGGYLWLGYLVNERGWISQSNLNFNYSGSALYAGNQRTSSSGELLWDYDRFHHQFSGGNINGWGQFRNYWQAWFGVWHDHEGTSRFETRGGPLMTTRSASGFWLGGQSDFRKRLRFDSELELNWNAAGRRQQNLEMGMNWSMNSRMSHSVSAQLDWAHRDAQHISAEDFDPSLQDPDDTDNFVTPAGAVGIGGTSYVFGELDTRNFDLTLRSSFLFTRNQSLELYMQPFMTIGKYRNPRELVTPDTYDLRTFPEDATFQAAAADFNESSVNLNLVYRWEYRPGSTLYLVWTHSRETNVLRGTSNGAFDDHYELGSLTDNEPENVFLVKMSYWFAI